MRPLIVIEDSVIHAMLQDQRYRTLLPCLDLAANQIQNNGKCSRCDREKAREQGKILTAVRDCLARLPADQRTALKQLMQCQKARVVYRNASNRDVIVTF